MTGSKYHVEDVEMAERTRKEEEEDSSSDEEDEGGEKADKSKKHGGWKHGYGFEEHNRNWIFVQDKSLWVRFDMPLFGEIRFNPVVTFFAICLIWGFVTICIVLREDVPFKEWRGWIVEKFTWLYIGSQDVWFFFVVILYFSKYSDIKLGKKDDKPEYGDATWFMMLFACGIGVGLFFFGVAEPVFHYTGANRYSADPTMPDNTLAQTAMNITLYHWGVHGWIVYSLVGLLLALLTYREGLPMTMKSCFYPLIGDRIFGWIGDLIDIISIMTTLFGVCTSLGLGTKQLNTGLTIMNSNIPEDDTTVQVIIIWCITAVATVSTVSGVGMGIRRLSEVCFGVGMFLMIIALLMDNTYYILNLYVQSIGFYFQWLLQLGFHTDAFEQLETSYGDEGRGRWTPEPDEVPSSRMRATEDGSKLFADGPDDWMDGWTMFYWGWWISWCPFVGMFIAKISKGRTIKQFINGTLTAPVIYSFMWLVIFGGAGIRLERLAAKEGLCCADTEGWFNFSTFDKEYLKSRNLYVDVPFEASSSYLLCDNGTCGTCALSVLQQKEAKNHTYENLIKEHDKLGNDFGSVTSDRGVSYLSCHSTEQMWFDVMRSYSDIGEFLAGFSLVGIILYFVTSSDSGSLVIDCLSANGDPDPPRLQRVFWALTEGATATALLVAGGKEGLVALQTAGLLSGLPYTFLVCLICTSIWRACKVAAGDLDPDGPRFAVGLFDPFFAQPWGQLREKCGDTSKHFVGFLKNIVTAPQTVSNVNKRLTKSRGSAMVVTVFAWATFWLFVIFQILQISFDGAWAIGWFLYLCFAAIMTAVRLQVRSREKIVGNVWEDFFASFLLYPCCAYQLDQTTKDYSDEFDEESGGAESGNYDLETKEGREEKHKKKKHKKHHKKHKAKDSDKESDKEENGGVDNVGYADEDNKGAKDD